MRRTSEKRKASSEEERVTSHVRRYNAIGIDIFQLVALKEVMLSFDPINIIEYQKYDQL